MDGNAAMKAIRASGEHNELPIIAITAKAMREDRAQALSSGASECVTKPVDMHKLSQLMDEWLH
jgi:CheY-like chemotaxis protein